MDESLSIEDLTKCVKQLLKPEGRFCMILPQSEGTKFIHHASSCGLHLNRLTGVRTKKDKPPKRLLMEFTLKRTSPITNELIILNEDMSYTDEFRDLTADFYPALPLSRS
jgi:tRNA1Val (adenine37-N6)-methyltransferase